MKLKNLKVLVTGGTGFLGSHIVERCLNEGSYVRVFSTGNTTDKIRHLVKNPCLSVIQGDITDFNSLMKATKGIDLVMHFASFTRTGETYYAPLKDFKTNVSGTLLLLEAMRKNEVGKIVFASTGKVYGNAQYTPIDEKHPIEPVDPYGVGKYVCEKYISLYHKLFKAGYINLRIFGIYGPRQLPKPGSLVGVISIFVENILKGKDIAIYGDGSLKRDFLYIDDFVNITFNLIKHGLWGNTFNIASGRQVTLREVVEILSRELKSHKFKVRFKRPLKSDVDLVPDISFLKSKIDYRPGISLEEGITRYIAWYKEQVCYGPKAV